jgi:glyoxylate carboligase
MSVLVKMSIQKNGRAKVAVVQRRRRCTVANTHFDMQSNDCERVYYPMEKNGGNECIISSQGATKSDEEQLSWETSVYMQRGNE